MGVSEGVEDLRLCYTACPYACRFLFPLLTVYMLIFQSFAQTDRSRCSYYQPQTMPCRVSGHLDSFHADKASIRVESL